MNSVVRPALADITNIDVVRRHHGLTAESALEVALQSGPMFLLCLGKRPEVGIVSHAFVATSAPKGTLTTELVAKDTSAAKNILLDIQVIVTMD